MSGAFLRQLLFFSFSVSLISAECSFSLNGEIVIEQRFGFHRMIFKKKNTQISLYVGENIKAYCETSFEYQNDYLGNQIEISCNSRYANYRRVGSNTWSQLYYELHCSRGALISLYENFHHLPKCWPDTSLVIAASVLNFTSTVYAGICYNWNEKDLKYVNYLAYKPKNFINSLENKENELKIRTDPTGIKIVGYASKLEFMNSKKFADAYNILKEKYTLLKNLEFDYSNLMQDVPLQDVFEKYDDILSIIWWRNLRLNNWRTFLDLLEERSKTFKYNVIIGTSGQMYIPNPANNCMAKEVFAIEIEQELRKVAPLYIWSYLKTISGNSTDDFVVIGYNSPFYTANDSSIVLCEDICESVEWMRTFGIRRLMPTMGLIICCRPADVVDKLDNFPWTADVVAEEPKVDEIYINSSSEDLTNTTSNTEVDIKDYNLNDEYDD